MRNLTLIPLFILIAGCTVVKAPFKVAGAAVSVSTQAVSTAADVATTTVSIASDAASLATSAAKTAHTAKSVTGMPSNELGIAIKVVKAGAKISEPKSDKTN